MSLCQWYKGDRQKALKRLYGEGYSGVWKKKCVVCGSVFYCCRPEGLYCSYRCSNDAYIKRRRERKIKARNKVCLVCGVSFQAKRIDTLYCSASCKQKAYRQRVTNTSSPKLWGTYKSNNETSANLHESNNNMVENLPQLEPVTKLGGN